MSLVNFASLDFDQIKESIKSYLRSNSTFTDYDFEGSNLSILIDVLAYNTYISSYNANMLSNEVFLDGATLRENVVSLARNIGYLPKSVTAPRALISFYIDVTEFESNPVSLTLKQGIVCTTSINFGDRSFVFSIPSDITVPVTNGFALFENIEIYEGIYTVNNFTVDSFNKNQKFVLNNANIDTSTVRVVVREDKNSSISRVYKFVDNISTVKSTDNVFFLNEIEDQRYELIFGDGTFGSKLENDNYIISSYIITSGELGNGIEDFTFSGRLFDNNGSPILTANPPAIIVNQSSQGGSSIESVSSIKKYAPRVYASQNRAVTATDYESLIPQIYPETESVSVFGGEELDPPKFGKVFITVKPKNGSYVPNNVKDNLKVQLRNYSVVGIIPEFIDLKYLYIEYDARVYYNTNLVQNSEDVKSLVTSNIIKYSKSSELNKYGSRFKYSKFLKLIDDSSDSITSNITRIAMRRDMKIQIGSFAEYEICFGNEFHIKNKAGYNVKSSGFTVSGISGTVYIADTPPANESESIGNIFLFRFDGQSNPIVIRKSIGNIDYKKGEIRINSINIIDTVKKSFGDNIVQFSAIPKSNDVIGKQDLYIQLDVTSSSVNMISDVISSGIDISGSQYIVSSSYLNGDLVRQ
jgi:hypothetical protein